MAIVWDLLPLARDRFEKRYCPTVSNMTRVRRRKIFRTSSELSRRRCEKWTKKRRTYTGIRERDEREVDAFVLGRTT